MNSTDVLIAALRRHCSNKQKSHSKRCYELCTTLSRGQRCSRGAQRCAFAHSLADLTPKVRQKSFKKQKCWRLAKGSCSFGPRCIHDHGETRLTVNHEYTVYTSSKCIFVVQQKSASELNVYTLPPLFLGRDPEILTFMNAIYVFIMVKNNQRLPPLPP
eukprot:UN24690